MMSFLKILLFPIRLALYSVILVFAVILASNLIIIISSERSLFDNVADIPPHKTAVVLGTSRFLQSGEANPWFNNRIMAAAELYHAGKVDFLILSGDNRTIYYNEPEMMRREIRKYNVPDSVLFLDYAGLRTLDSMIRSKEIFGQDSVIIISQKFHNQRAVFLAKAHNIKAVGYNAQNPESHNTTRVLTREVFARVKVFIDLITRKQPRFLGDKVPVGE
jgi:SanA protein